MEEQVLNQMLAVKRPAEEELFRNPKQPRTKMTRQDGAVASPSEREGIRSSFARLVRGLSVILSGEKGSVIWHVLLEF